MCAVLTLLAQKSNVSVSSGGGLEGTCAPYAEEYRPPYVCMSIHLNTYIYTYGYTYIYIYIYVCMYIYILYIYIYIYIS